MNRETFDKFIENYDSKDEILVSQMALLIEKYPYFQLPRFFYTKSLKDQNKNDLTWPSINWRFTLRIGVS